MIIYISLLFNVKMKNKRGKLIVIEGSDSSGKATQTSKLIERLHYEGHSAEHMSFPQYETPTGRIIGQCYLGKSREEWRGDSGWFPDAVNLDPKIASLYYAADRRAALPRINAIVNSGRNLVMDRYVPSNMAHQGGKAAPKERINIINFLDKLEYDLLELPRPDNVILLYMPFEVAIELRKNRNEIADGHESNIEHLKRAEETYLELFLKYNWIRIDCAPDRTAKSLRSIDDIGNEVYERATEILKQKS